MPKTETIVKVQRPLFGGAEIDGKLLHLVYDKARKHQHEQVLSASAERALRSDPKGYFKATREPGYGAWVIGKRVPNQDW